MSPFVCHDVLLPLVFDSLSRNRISRSWRPSWRLSFYYRRELELEERERERQFAGCLTMLAAASDLLTGNIGSLLVDRKRFVTRDFLVLATLPDFRASTSISFLSSSAPILMNSDANSVSVRTHLPFFNIDLNHVWLLIIAHFVPIHFLSATKLPFHFLFWELAKMRLVLQ